MEKKIILHLCADTGSDSRPYHLYGTPYQVILVGKDIGVENYHPPKNVYGIFANPVCTEFSTARSSGKARNPEKGMVRNRKLARAISDAGWSTLVRQIEYKQLWKGGEVVKIDRFFPSSKLCNVCDFIAETMPLSVRKWKCGGCNTEHDRDINAAKNILKEALACRVRGVTVRPSRQVAKKRGQAVA